MSINTCFKIQFIYHCTAETVEENESSDMILYGFSFSINTTNHDKSRAERKRNDLKTTALLLPRVLLTQN